MWIVPMSELSAPELALIGNNVRPRGRAKHRSLDDLDNRRVLSAVNRSLASLRERVDRVDAYPPSGPRARREPSLQQRTVT